MHRATDADVEIIKNSSQYRQLDASGIKMLCSSYVRNFFCTFFRSYKAKIQNILWHSFKIPRLPNPNRILYLCRHKLIERIFPIFFVHKSTHRQNNRYGRFCFSNILGFHIVFYDPSKIRSIFNLDILHCRTKKLKTLQTLKKTCKFNYFIIYSCVVQT